MLVSCLAYSLNLKMKLTCSSETLVDFQWTTWNYISENKTVHSHCCENLKSYTEYYIPYDHFICNAEFKDPILDLMFSQWDVMGYSPGEIHWLLGIKYRKIVL
jgi:hypothetical protein